MIRPEAAATLRRWREAMLGVGALIIGAWLWATSSGLPALFGIAIACVGTVLAISGTRRARFRTEAEAPGVVKVVEGQISYMGPLTGGAIAIDMLAEVAFRRMSDTEGFWRLTAIDNKTLFIPEGALGADALLDAFSPLSDFDGGAMVRAVRGRTSGLTIVWRREAPAALT